MSSATGTVSLEELRRAYRSCTSSHQGHCSDHAHAEALIAALEKEVARLSTRMDRTGTVYHAPKAPKAAPA